MEVTSFVLNAQCYSKEGRKDNIDESKEDEGKEEMKNIRKKERM